ncbi:MAG: hypothetical protein J4400_02990 [Candidatus Aenigmarchaeota archaeon]|nr:hypothetical protein [Candidatus Aenigmarchaeota archaeon]
MVNKYFAVILLTYGLNGDRHIQPPEAKPEAYVAREAGETFPKDEFIFRMRHMPRHALK